MSKWYDGASLPISQLGQNGDYYLQLSNSDIFRKTYDIWYKIGNIKGTKGDRGNNGANGIDGANGVNGLDGNDGRDGINGNKWLHGVGIPNDSMGLDEDYYVDLYTKDIFQKNLSIWERVGSFLLDGRKVELRNVTGAVEYRYEGEDDTHWRVLVQLADIKGDKGDKGDIGLTPSIAHLETLINNKIQELDTSENVRVANENKRITTYDDIKLWHTNVVNVEQSRVSSESSRSSAEIVRNTQENSRQSSIVQMRNDVDSYVSDASNRVNQVIASGTVDLEVKDARISQNGTTYICLNDRLNAIETSPYIYFESVEG